MLLRLLSSLSLAFALTATSVPSGATSSTPGPTDPTSAGGTSEPAGTPQEQDSPSVTTPAPDPQETSTPEPSPALETAAPEVPAAPAAPDPNPVVETPDAEFAPLPSGGPIGRVEAVVAAPGSVTASGWAIDPDTTGPIIVQMYVDGSQYTMDWADLARSHHAPVVARVILQIRRRQSCGYRGSKGW